MLKVTDVVERIKVMSAAIKEISAALCSCANGWMMMPEEFYGKVAGYGLVKNAPKLFQGKS